MRKLRSFAMLSQHDTSCDESRHQKPKQTKFLLHSNTHNFLRLV